MKKINILVLHFVMFALVNCNVSKTPDLDNMTATNEDNMNLNSSSHTQVHKKANNVASRKSSIVDLLINSIIDFASNIIGDILGLLSTFFYIEIGPSTKKSEIADHFEKTKDKLENINQKLTEAKDQISEKIQKFEQKERIEENFKRTKDLIIKLNGALDKFLITKDVEAELATGFKDETEVESGEIKSNKEDVNTIIEGVKTIFELGKVYEITEINQVTLNEVKKQTLVIDEDNGISLILGVGLIGACSSKQKDVENLKKIVDKTSGWATIYVIGTTEINNNNISPNNAYGARALAINESVDTRISAKTEEDLAATLVLRAMSKTGRFSFDESKSLSSEKVVSIVKETVSSAVYKVINVIDAIIKTVIEKEINKLNESIKNII